MARQKATKRAVSPVRGIGALGRAGGLGPFPAWIARIRANQKLQKAVL